MPDKLRIALFFGGKSAEHEISLQSAKNVLDALNKDKYEIIPVGITREGDWYLESDIGIHPCPAKHIVLDLGQSKQLIGVNDKHLRQSFDVALPILHGPNGEDGTIQGLFQLANIPFVGSGTLASSLCMDKVFMKHILQQAGIPIADYVTVNAYQYPSINHMKILQRVGLPCFVKPANMGSSVGISKVKIAEDLNAAIELALRYDTKVIIEAFIQGREIECAILGNEQPKASLPGEIIPHHEFYSYEAKYLDDNGAELSLPAAVTAEQQTLIQDTAIKAFKALACAGMARVDMFLTADGQAILNEVNTIPGFTRISMYPKLWDISGLPYPNLLDELIQLALAHFDKRQQLDTKH